MVEASDDPNSYKRFPISCKLQANRLRLTKPLFSLLKTIPVLICVPDWNLCTLPQSIAAVLEPVALVPTTE